MTPGRHSAVIAFAFTKAKSPSDGVALRYNSPMKYARVEFAGASYSGPYDPAKNTIFAPAEAGAPLPAYPLTAPYRQLASPVQPGKIVCIGRNYRQHAREMGGEVPPEPLFFLKAPSAVVGPNDAIVIPAISGEVHFEGELAIVIGEECRRISEAEAAEFIFGYTILNDVTARDLQKSDGQWSRAKSFDTFCPIGPWVDTEFVPGHQRLITRVNGEIRQDCPLSDMTYSTGRLIEHISRVMTLLPGDVIATGTPAGVGRIVEGDVVEIEIEGLGKLSNPVKGED